MKNVGLSWTGAIMLVIANNIGACFVCLFFNIAGNICLLCKDCIQLPQRKTRYTGLLVLDFYRIEL